MCGLYFELLCVQLDWIILMFGVANLVRSCLASLVLPRGRASPACSCLADVPRQPGSALRT